MAPSYNQLKAFPRWKKVTFTSADFSAAAGVFQIPIYTLQPYEFVHKVKIIPTVDFSGGTIASYTIQVGGDAGNNVFAPATDVFTGNSTATDLIPTAVIGGNQGNQTIAGTSVVTADATCVGDTLDNATQGEVDIYLLISELPH